MSLVWSLDRVTQVVMDGLTYYPFHFVEKKNPEHARKNCKVLRVVHREGEFFTVPTVFALEGSIEKIVLRWNEYSFWSYMGPNQERIMDQMASRLSVWPQVSFIETGTYEGIGHAATIWILCLCFCCGSTVWHWWRFCLFAVNYISKCDRPGLITLAKIWKPPLLLLRLCARQGRCCVGLL